MLLPDLTWDLIKEFTISKHIPDFESSICWFMDYVHGSVAL